jgi:hypothetical protein
MTFFVQLVIINMFWVIEGKVMSMYHDGMRDIQDRYGGRKVADRLEEHRKHTKFTKEDREFIQNAPFFFLATAWNNTVDCSMKSGYPGFVQVTGAGELC